MMNINKKGYTLSEFILIAMLVVIFAGMLFLTLLHRAATKQAREAEQLMQAVRYEQEDRCVIGRKYEVYANRLRAFLKKKQGTKHVTYDLGSGMGIVAKSKWYNFTLKMPSYADGRICCDNCEKLNRHYSPCSVLLRRKDFVPVEEECAFYPEKVSRLQDKIATLSTGSTAQKEAVSPANDTAQPSQVAAENAQTEPTSSSVLQPQAQPVSQQPAAQAESPVLSSQPEETAQESTCPTPEKGTFYITQCDTYEAGTQGAVLFTWNAQTCQYDVVQNCLIPARWKSNKAVEREEKEVYPSDVDKLCAQLLASNKCAEDTTQNKECFEVGETCYDRCEVVDKQPVQESATIVLYNVTLSVRSKQCQPSKNVTVTIP